MITTLNAYLDDFIPHWHNRTEYVQYHILVLVTEGRLTYRLNGEELEASKGDLLYIPAGTHREAFNPPDTLHQKYAITFDVAAALGLPLLEGLRPRKTRPRAFDFIRERFASVYQQYLERRSCHELIAAGILLEILGHVQRELTAQPLPRRKLQYAEAIERHIVGRFREPLALEVLARLIGRSPNYALSVFKEASGMTPIEYQHQLRVHAAIDMLRNTDMTVAAIADHLGYYDASSFYKAFRKRTGRPPSDYRRPLSSTAHPPYPHRSRAATPHH